MQNTVKQSTERVLWIDALKGFAIISVVLGHALYGFMQTDMYPSAQNVITFLKDWIYTWHMPLFFVLSGITYRLSMLKSSDFPLKKLVRSTVNLGIIYIIFASALPLLKMVFSAFVNNKVSPSELVEIILLPNTYMWYIWVLIIYQWIFAFLYYRKSNLPLLMSLLTIITITGTILNDTGILTRTCLKNLLICAVFFGMGIWYNEIKKIVFRKWFVIISIFTAILCTAYMMFMYLVEKAEIPTAFNICVSILNSFAVSIILLYVFEKTIIFGHNKFLTSVGKNSLAIYLLHTYLVTAMRTVVVKLDISNAAGGVLLAFIVPLFVTYAAGLIIPQIPVVRYLFKPIALIDKLKDKGKSK